MTLPYNINDAVLLSRQREGIIRYIGKVHFSSGIWCGIELVGGSLGTNDGKIHGRRYFSCSHHRGLFCKANRVRRKFRNKDHSSASRQKRKASLEQRLYHKTIVKKVLQSELELKKKYDNKRYNSKCQAPYTVDVGNVKITNSRPNVHTKANWLNERLRSPPTKELKQKSKSHKPFKPGPRDIGRIEGWQPIEYEQPKDNGGFMAERLDSPSTSKLKRIRAKKTDKMYKFGPRDLKKTHSGWIPIELTAEEEARLNAGRFLDDRKRIRTSRNAKKGMRRAFKAGPRDIGRNSGTDWTPIEISKEEEDRLNSGSFLDDRISRKRSKPSKNGRVFKAGPRDIGRNDNWRQKPVSPSKKRQKRQRKQLHIAVNNCDVDPHELRRSKKENKALMKGKKDKMKNGRVYKPGPRDIGRNDNWKQREISSSSSKRSKRRNNRQKHSISSSSTATSSSSSSKRSNKKKEDNEAVFNSFRMDRQQRSYTHTNGYDPYSTHNKYKDEHRQSVKVELNRENQSKKEKHVINKKPRIKQRHSEKYPSKSQENIRGYIRNALHNTAIVSNAKYTPYNAIRRQRNSVHEHINYQNFTSYNPKDNNNIIDDVADTRHYSASHESESTDLDDIHDIIPPNTNKESVYELFGIEKEEKEIIIHDFIDDDDAPSGHDDIIVYDSSPSGHDKLFEFDIIASPPKEERMILTDRVSLTAALFSDEEDQHIKHIRQYNVPTKPLPKPRKKEKKKKKGRIKGIAQYTGKWSVSFKEIKPVMDRKRNRTKSRSRARSRSSSRAKKSEAVMTAFIYSIYKDGSVQIQPKTAFGWNGSAHIVYDSSRSIYEIHPMESNRSDEYEYMSMNRNGTLNIEHFKQCKPIIGIGIRC